MSRAILFTAFLCLAACSQPSAPASETPVAVAPEPAAPPPATVSPTVGGDGSQIVLNVLTPAEIGQAQLHGDLACAFTAPEGLLVIAKGEVDEEEPAFGVVKVGDYVERIAAPGGFDAMVKGAVFSGQGKTIRVALTGPPVGGGESPPSPATLTYQRMDGAERVFAGTWTCGP